MIKTNVSYEVVTRQGFHFKSRNIRLVEESRVTLNDIARLICVQVMNGSGYHTESKRVQASTNNYRMPYVSEVRIIKQGILML